MVIGHIFMELRPIFGQQPTTEKIDENGPKSSIFKYELDYRSMTRGSEKMHFWDFFLSYELDLTCAG